MKFYTINKIDEPIVNAVIIKQKLDLEYSRKAQNIATFIRIHRHHLIAASRMSPQTPLVMIYMFTVAINGSLGSPIDNEV